MIWGINSNSHCPKDRPFNFLAADNLQRTQKHRQKVVSLFSSMDYVLILFKSGLFRPKSIALLTITVKVETTISYKVFMYD